jgi:hypothetical protein
VEPDTLAAELDDTAASLRLDAPPPGTRGPQLPRTHRRDAPAGLRALGYDRQLTIGVLASFAAREVFASTMAVQVAGTEDFEDEGIQARIAGAPATTASPVFTRAVELVAADLLHPGHAVPADAGGHRQARPAA